MHSEITTLYSDLDKVVEVVNTLRAYEEDGWTYNVIYVGKLHAIQVADETGEVLGYL
jgi:hypothetical protein